jgi:hypothetical protein
MNTVEGVRSTQYAACRSRRSAAGAMRTILYPVFNLWYLIAVSVLVLQESCRRAAWTRVPRIPPKNV